MPDTHPFVKTIEFDSPGQGTAGTDTVWVLGKAPFACTVTGVTYTAAGAIAGHASNNRALSVINKGAAGSGSTSVAALTTTASPDNSFAAFDEKAITLSGTAANLVLAAGDILAWSSDANASGVADPGGKVIVTISRN